MKFLGGFACSRNALIALNIFYFIVGIILISLGSSGSQSIYIANLPIIGGVIASGVFLSAISVAGIVGAIKHHQVTLFFYMVILLIVFLIQFSVACACLAASDETQKDLLDRAWRNADSGLKDIAQSNLKCCGFQNVSIPETDPSGLGHPSCFHITECRSANCTVDGGCCSMDNPTCGCKTCELMFENLSAKAFKATGGVSLFFSFTEFIGIWLSYRFRNMKNPFQPTSSAFL